MYEMYQQNGINAHINVSRSLLDNFVSKNKQADDTIIQDQSKLSASRIKSRVNDIKANISITEKTNGFLQQINLIDDDFLALTYDGFERLLIFDRTPPEKTADIVDISRPSYRAPE